MAAVHIRNVHKHFGGTHVIRGVDIDIADGEFAVLVGATRSASRRITRARICSMQGRGSR